tara:strand:+ start:13 stop:741 length:729 start_codon:yes stop_codon:yes gene_type:complete
MKERGMLIMDAFRAFDYDRNGLLSPEELYGGMTWLGVELTPTQAKELALQADCDKDGNVSFRDFYTTFKPYAEDVEGKGENESDVFMRENWMEIEYRDDESASEAALDKWKGITPRIIEEDKGPKAVSINDIVARIRQAAMKLHVSVKTINSYLSIWDSKGSGSRVKASVWAPRIDAKYFSTKVRICVGHYAARGHSSPHDGIARCILTLVDKGKWPMMKSPYLDPIIVNAFFPFPIRYTQV